MYIKALLFVFVLTESTQAQIDYKSFEREKDIKEKSVKALFLWNEYMRHDIDSAKILGLNLLSAATEVDYDYGIAIASRSLGSYFIRSGKIEKGIDFLKKAKITFIKIEDALLCSETLNELGNAYQLAGKFKQSKACYLESIKYGAKSNDGTSWFGAEIGLGKLLYYSGEVETGKTYLKHYKNCAISAQKFESAADAYGFLATIEMDGGDEHLADHYLNQSIECAMKSNSMIHVAHAYTNKAISFYIHEQYDSSLYLFRESLHLKRVLNNNKGIVESLFNLGDYYEGLGQIDSAVHYYRASLKIAADKVFISDVDDAIEMLTKIGIDDDFSKLKDSVQDVVDRIDKEDLKLIASLEEKNERKVQDENNKGWLIWVWAILLTVSAIIITIYSKRRKSIKFPNEL